MGTNEQDQAPLQANTHRISSIAFSPDARRLVSGGSDNIVRIWDVAAGQQVFNLEGHDLMVASVAYSPDGLYVVSASHDKTLRLWDADTGTNFSTLFGHSDRVLSVVFTPDGRSVISGAADTTIHIWDVEAALTLSSQVEHHPLSRLGSARLDEDGWLVEPSGELLLWVPFDYRGHVQLPPCSMVIGSHRVVLTTDDGLNWGDQWTACRRSDPLSIHGKTR